MSVDISAQSVVKFAISLAPLCFSTGIPLMYLSYENIPGPKDALVARFALPMLSDVGRHDPPRIIFTTGLCLLSAVYVVLIMITDRYLWQRINRMSSQALALSSPHRLTVINQRARWVGLISVALLAMTALVPNNVSLMIHNTVAAVHFVTSAIWGLMIVHILDRTSPHGDPQQERHNRRGITLKKWLAITNLVSSFMVVALFGVFKSLNAEDDHRQSPIMDATPWLQWLRWVAWPMFEYVVVACENILTWTLYYDFAGLNFQLNVVPKPVVTKPCVPSSPSSSSSLYASFNHEDKSE